MQKWDREILETFRKCVQAKMEYTERMKSHNYQQLSSF